MFSLQHILIKQMSPRYAMIKTIILYDWCVIENLCIFIAFCNLSPQTISTDLIRKHCRITH